MLAWVVISRLHPRQARPASSLCFFFYRHSLLTTHYPLSFFSFTYELPNLQALCFDNHTTVPGVGTPHPAERSQTMTTQTPDVEILSPENPSAPTVADPPPGDSRCQHRYRNGTRCRLRGSDSQFGLCSSHFRQKVASALPPSPNDSADLSEDLLGDLSHFSSAEDLREFLTRLLVLMTKGGVSPRRAAVLAYITNQLLHSHCVVQKEEKEMANDQPIIFDLPRPQRD